MCIAWIAYHSHPEYPVILAANRDEFFSRPTAAAAYWPDHPGIAGGRDLKDQGTWFASDQYGRFGLLTNHRDFSLHKDAAESRGVLIPCYLSRPDTAPMFLNKVLEDASDFNPFNLILHDGHGLYHFDNVHKQITALSPGLYGLSNAFLDTPWPKLLHGKTIFSEILSSNPDQLEPEMFLPLLKDNQMAPDQDLPSTGLDLDLEKKLSSIYIDAGTYGTRAHTIFMIDRMGFVTLFEQSLLHDASGSKNWRTTTLKYKLIASE
jgi:uncharacterized protein with NRDE domain